MNVRTPPRLVALIVNVLLPKRDGVPLIIPVVAFKDNPGGNDPLETAHLTVLYETAVNVWLYGVPISPLGNEPVVISGIEGSEGVLELGL